jgi:pimeloyl-ACP methyl ester carboxylesterase
VVDARRVAGRAVSFRHEPGRAPSLVCVHGSAGNHRVYDRLLDAMPDRARYAVDLPGRLGTDGPALVTVAELEEFLTAFIEREVEGDYVVVGHSLGGGVAIEHALVSNSDRLKGLVLLATGARLRVHPMILQVMEQAEKSGVRPPLVPGLHEDGVDPALLEEAARPLERTPIASGASDWRAADAFDRMQDLDDIEVPALVLVGSTDVLTPPKYAEHLAALIPKSTLRVFQGAGHSLMTDRATEVAEAIEGFCQSQIGA